MTTRLSPWKVAAHQSRFRPVAARAELIHPPTACDGYETFPIGKPFMDIIERAYELARDSKTVEEVRRALVREGYESVNAHLAGPTIKADLKKCFSAP